MANAKKCDICGKYYDIPDINPYQLDYDERLNYIRMHRSKDSKRDDEDVILHFDSCKNCYQDVMDYILSKQADAN